MAEPNWSNRTLFHGDNLGFLRAMNSESVDLIATDPPFNKGRDFHATPDSLASGAKFIDRWTWERDAQQEWVDQIRDDYPHLMEAIESARYAHSDGMGAFMCFMAVRLLEMRRVLKASGSIYLHFDSTAVHYLKAVMDAIFGWRHFVNEIVWQKVRSSKAQKAGFGEVHDTILLYRKSGRAITNKLYSPLSPERIKRHYGRFEPETGRRYGLYDFTQAGPGPERRFGDRIVPPPSGKHWIWDQDRIDKAWGGERLVFTSKNMVRVKRYLDESKGNPIEDIWVDIPPINAVSKERVGYPTQKPSELYERMILARSKPKQMILDPFAGCATTLIAAERLNRKWVGIDIWHNAKAVVLKRMAKERMALPEAESGDLFTEYIHFTATPPKRTDDGLPAAPALKLQWSQDEPPGPQMSRAQMYDALLASQGAKCQGCNRVFDDPRYLELDHNIPRSDGGLNHISNRILLCGPCNKLKSNIYTLSGLQRENRKRGYLR